MLSVDIHDAAINVANNILQAIDLGETLEVLEEEYGIDPCDTESQDYATAVIHELSNLIIK